MTLGEKIRFLRAKDSITQETLAEKLNVSRSAIAKWETNNGTPDIGNLKRISQMFAISMDDLLDDNYRIDASSIKDVRLDNGYSEYMGYFCNIELKGWNDGVFNVLIVGEDKDFIFYKRKEKEQYLYGLIGRKYIKSIDRDLNCKTLSEYHKFAGKDYFCMKHVCLEVAAKDGFIKGFFDFRNDDYIDVIINSFTDNEIVLEVGGVISIDDVSKIEELKV